MQTVAPSAKKYRKLNLDWGNKKVVRLYKNAYQWRWRANPENRAWERLREKAKGR